MNDVLETYVDTAFPTITREIARLTFGLIDPVALHGYERDDYEKIGASLDQAGPDHADHAWDAAIQLVDYLPLDDLAPRSTDCPTLTSRCTGMPITP